MRTFLICVFCIFSTLFLDSVYDNYHSPYLHPQYIDDSSIYTDGYKFKAKNLIAGDRVIRIILHPSRKNLQEYFGDDRLAAMTVTFDERRLCEVHIVDPIVSYEPEYLGHEVFHCMYGNWHPDIK